jgi:uncharacterized alpha-E superfamily protein
VILARHAESLFWAGRYLERAETTSRWLDVASRAAMHLLPDEAATEWSELLRALDLRADFEAGHDHTVRRDVATFLLSAPDNPGSVRSAVVALRENLRVARDRLPVELWEETNRLHLKVSYLDVEATYDRGSHEIYSMIREGCQTISGVMAEAMTRDEGHAFIGIGRMLERSVLTVGLLKVSFTNARGVFDGERVLRSSSALQAYRRLHGHGNDPVTTAAFLLETPNVPRSVFSCLRQAETRLDMLRAGSLSVSVPEQLAGRLRSRLEYGEIVGRLGADPQGVLTEVDHEIRALAESVTTHVFRPLGEAVIHAQFVRPGGRC